ncbi:MAG: hypothetical protein IJB86_05825 [Clostridia bacterium]|nr:hypothetical protein [Clostridia bacterium]
MYKKLLSFLLAVSLVCTALFTVSAVTTPDFLKEMPVPRYMQFSTEKNKSLDLLSVTVAVEQDFIYFLSLEDTLSTYGVDGDFYIQFDWSIDDCAWSYDKSWNNPDADNTLTYKLSSELIQSFDIFDLTVEADKQRFAQGIRLENGKDAFYYPEHTLTIRARYLFADSSKDEPLSSEWSDSFSVNDDYYNKNSRSINVIDFGLPTIVDNIRLKKATDFSDARITFDWFFDGEIENVAFNLYAINGQSLILQEQICVGQDGTWVDIESDSDNNPYICGLKTIDVSDDLLQNGNYFKYRMRYSYPGDLGSKIMSFHSAWSDSIVYDNGKVTLVNETDDEAALEDETLTEATENPAEKSNLISPIVYVILIFVLLCFLFGILTGISETRRERREAMEKAGIVKTKKKK